MGYMTFYTLGWNTPKEKPSVQENRRYEGVDRELGETIMGWLQKDLGFDSQLEHIDSYGASSWSKWAEHDEDMIRLSRNFPQVLFVLDGAGEEDGDLWRTYYLSGLLQYAPAQITYPPFDPRELAEP